MKRQSMRILAAVIFAGAAFAQDSPVTVPWGELSGHINGKTVAMVLPGGAEIKGKVRGVEASGLHIDISRTSDKRVQPKGLQLVPKQSVSVLRVNADRKIGRILGTVGAVAAAGTLAAVAATNSGISEGVGIILVPAVAAGGTIGAGIGGYYIGRAIDRRETIIRVIP